MSDASHPTLEELLRKSRELRVRLTKHTDDAAKLKKRVDQAKKRIQPKSYFSPE